MQEQCMQFGQEIEKQYDLSLTKYTYAEFFNRIRSGDASKLIVIIDEFQYIAKRDEEFLKAVIKLKTKKLYPGPVMILLASSSVAWMEQELDEQLGGSMNGSSWMTLSFWMSCVLIQNIRSATA